MKKISTLFLLNVHHEISDVPMTSKKSCTLTRTPSSRNMSFVACTMPVYFETPPVIPLAAHARLLVGSSCTCLATHGQTVSKSLLLCFLHIHTNTHKKTRHNTSLKADYLQNFLMFFAYSTPFADWKRKDCSVLIPSLFWSKLIVTTM